MSDETTELDRDQRTGRFLPGNSGFSGRPKGARSKLGEAFLEDLRDAWLEHGSTALRRCATEEPAQFVRVIASLMPKDVNLNMTVSAGEFAANFRHAVELLGNSEPSKLRRPLRDVTPKEIEHEPR